MGVLKKQNSKPFDIFGSTSITNVGAHNPKTPTATRRMHGELSFMDIDPMIQEEPRNRKHVDGHINVALHSVATALGSSIGAACIDTSAPTHSYTSNASYASKDQHLHLFGRGRSPSNKGTTPSNIHIIQQPDAMLTTPANTICPPQYTIYDSATTACNEKQQLCGHGKNTHRRRVAQPHPNSQVKPNKQPAIASKCTNHATTYNHRTEKNSNHRKSINNKFTDLLAATTLMPKKK